MKPIGAYVEVCQKLTPEQFCEHKPHSVLLHTFVSGPLLPTDKTRGITVDRLVIGDNVGIRGGGESTQEEAYIVFELVPVNPQAMNISIGCSSTCDVQINDESVSTLHAYLEREGDEYRIRDNDSSAGTKVNGEDLGTGDSGFLASGDRVSLGYIDMTFLTPADFYQFVRRFLRRRFPGL